MGITKTDYFSDEQNHLAHLLKALAHPARVAIIQHLLKHSSCICNELVKELPLSQSTISQHLKELKSAEIIKGTIEGNSMNYCLNPSTIEELLYFFQCIDNHIKNS